MADFTYLRRRAVSGVKWIGLSTVAASAIQLIQIAILTRFLSPADFGLMAMAMVVVGVVQAFNDMGISNAVIQRKDATEDRLSSLFWLQVAGGIGLFLLIILIAPLTTDFYNEKALTGVMLSISLIFLVTPPGQLFQSILQKGLRFRALAIVEIAASAIGMIAAIAAAYVGLGVLALVIGQISFFGLRSLLLVVAGLPMWRPRLHFRAADLRGYMSFGMYQMGERVITYMSINIINLIIGRYLGADMLGRYSVAYDLTLNPVLRINTVIMWVAFPILSMLQGANDLLTRIYLGMTRVISLIMFPALTFAIVAAPAIVPLLLGPGWTDVIPIFQILCVVALFKVLGGTTVPTYLAKGRADLGFSWNLAIAVAYGIVFYIAAGYGIIALALSFVAVSFAQFIVMQAITGRIIGLKWNAYLGTIATDAAKSIVVGAVAYATYAMGIIALPGPEALLSVVSVASGATYLTMALSSSRKFFLRMGDRFGPVKKLINALASLND